MARAENAFARARAAAGTHGGVRMDAEIAARMAEIAARRREDDIADRLAVLRAASAPPPAADPAPAAASTPAPAARLRRKVRA